MDFEKFCAIVMPFLEEDDDEAMHEELKEAFRLYDKGGKCLKPGEGAGATRTESRRKMRV